MTQLTITTREQLRIDLEKAHQLIVDASFHLGLAKPRSDNELMAANELWQATHSFEKILDQVFK